VGIILLSVPVFRIFTQPGHIPASRRYYIGPSASKANGAV